MTEYGLWEESKWEQVTKNLKTGVIKKKKMFWLETPLITMPTPNLKLSPIPIQKVRRRKNPSQKQLKTVAAKSPLALS